MQRLSWSPDQNLRQFLDPIDIKPCSCSEEQMSQLLRRASELVGIRPLAHLGLLDL